MHSLTASPKDTYREENAEEEEEEEEDDDDDDGESMNASLATTATDGQPLDSADQASEPEPPAEAASEEPSSEEPPSDDTVKSRKRTRADENYGNGEEEEVVSPRKPNHLPSLASRAPDQQQPERDLSGDDEQSAMREAGVCNGEANGFLNGGLKTAARTGSSAGSGKKSKKKNSNVWVTKTTRKGKKKNKSGGNNNHNVPAEDTVLIAPVPRFPDRNDDAPDMKICLSKVYKAEKVELREDRLSAGSSKGYRMVRATRGVVEGAWYFEIKVERLGETGHTRLGWSTEKGDLQAPVGYDGNSFGYRDIDGSKVHKASREKYGEEGYKEGDVIGFYINLPDGGLYAPKSPQLVWYKGQRYVCMADPKEDPPKVVPGSEISFFRNGVCQGVAFEDLYGGRYYPAASMYTLPNEPNCVVRFNFGPKFECFPSDFGGRPIPKPLIEIPYQGYDSHMDNGGSTEQKH